MNRQQDENILNDKALYWLPFDTGLDKGKLRTATVELCNRLGRSFPVAIITFSYMFGFCIPALVAERPGIILAQGLIDGRLLAIGSFVVGAVTITRYGFASRANTRLATNKGRMFLIFALVKTVAIGVSVGAVAAVSQNPVLRQVFLVADTYSFNATPNRAAVLQAFVDEYEAAIDAGITAVFDDLHIEKIVLKAAENGVDERLSSALMRNIQHIKPVQVEHRLIAISLDSEDRIGDEVVVISGHRKPPDTASMRKAWPLPTSLSGRWEYVGVPLETRNDECNYVTTTKIFSDPSIDPKFIATGNFMTSESNVVCTVKMSEDEEGKKVIFDQTIKMLERTHGEGANGVVYGSSGTRRGIQIPLPRHPESYFVTLEVNTSAPMPIDFEWQRPLKISPNQILLRPINDYVSALLNRLPKYPVRNQPFLVLPVGPKINDQELVVVLHGFDISNITGPVLQLLESEASMESDHHVSVTANFEKSVLSHAGLPSGWKDDWPHFGEGIIINKDMKVYFETLSNEGKYRQPVVWCNQSNAKQWTVVMPTDEQSKNLIKNVRSGHRHVFLWAASMAWRQGIKGAWPVYSTVYVPHNIRNLAGTCGAKLERETLIIAMLRTLVSMPERQVSGSTPANSRRTDFATFTLTQPAISIFVTVIALITVASWMSIIRKDNDMTNGGVK